MHCPYCVSALFDGNGYWLCSDCGYEEGLAAPEVESEERGSPLERGIDVTLLGFLVVAAMLLFL